MENIMARRTFLKLLAGVAGGCLLPQWVSAQSRERITREIPGTGEMLPVIGMGSSRTFDAGGDAEMQANLAKVLAAFFQHGGTIIDSSPMYGSAEQVIGKLLQGTSPPDTLFAATKVWTNGRESGIRQMEHSRTLWGVERFDLMQIHNLLDWEVHLKTLRQMKADGKVRYIGITTSHGRYHQELAEILAKEPLDFVQLSYNIANRDVERELLPIARDRGIAVIVNRPFARGGLFRKVRGTELPQWAEEIGCKSWGQFFLKYAVSHPAVTCAIPATSKVKHMVDNMGAGFGRLPEPAMRGEMEQFFKKL